MLGVLQQRNQPRNYPQFSERKRQDEREDRRSSSMTMKSKATVSVNQLTDTFLGLKLKSLILPGGDVSLPLSLPLSLSPTKRLYFRWIDDSVVSGFSCSPTIPYPGPIKPTPFPAPGRRRQQSGQSSCRGTEASASYCRAAQHSKGHVDDISCDRSLYGSVIISTLLFIFLFPFLFLL